MAEPKVPELKPVRAIVEEIVNAVLRNLSRAGFAFLSADEAAIAALDEIYLKSVANNWEFAGRIFKRGGSFLYTPPSTLQSNHGSDPGPKLSNVENVGTYHSHAGAFLPTDEQFSPQDKLKAELGKEISYVITPRRKMMKYIPASLSPPGQQKPGALGKEVILSPGFTDGTAPSQLHQQLFSPTNLQKQGQQGEAIKVIQMLFNRRPPTKLANLAEDGIFGPKTLARVCEFRKQNQLQQDGVVGPRTRGVLFRTA